MRENANIPAAKRLRKQMTDAEMRLWYMLRDRRFAGVKFRRQHAIGPFVCDFISLDHALIIEVDGGQHAMAQHRDAQRTAYLEKEGFTVMRFWNNEVLENTEAVLTQIAAHCCHVPPSVYADEGAVITAHNGV